jgi:hypothetical protein
MMLLSHAAPKKQEEGNTGHQKRIHGDDDFYGEVRQVETA